MMILGRKCRVVQRYTSPNTIPLHDKGTIGFPIQSYFVLRISFIETCSFCFRFRLTRSADPSCRTELVIEIEKQRQRSRPVSNFQSRAADIPTVRINMIVFRR